MHEERDGRMKGCSSAGRGTARAQQGALSTSDRTIAATGGLGGAEGKLVGNGEVARESLCQGFNSGWQLVLTPSRPACTHRAPTGHLSSVSRKARKANAASQARQTFSAPTDRSTAFH